MGLALEEAQEAYKTGEIPIGAVITCKGQVIARAYNRVEALNDPTAHAEILAITAATTALGAKYLKDCTIYITIEPCTMCAGALRWAQIGRIVYGALEPKLGYSTFAPTIIHPKTLITHGVLEKECRELMISFFKERR